MDAAYTWLMQIYDQLPAKNVNPHHQVFLFNDVVKLLDCYAQHAIRAESTKAKATR